MTVAAIRNCPTAYHERMKRDAAWWARCRELPGSPCAGLDWRNCCEPGCFSTLAVEVGEVSDVAA